MLRAWNAHLDVGLTACRVDAEELPEPAQRMEAYWNSRGHASDSSASSRRPARRVTDIVFGGLPPLGGNESRAPEHTPRYAPKSTRDTGRRRTPSHIKPVAQGQPLVEAQPPHAPPADRRLPAGSYWTTMSGSTRAAAVNSSRPSPPLISFATPSASPVRLIAHSLSRSPNLDRGTLDWPTGDH